MNTLRKSTLLKRGVARAWRLYEQHHYAQALKWTRRLLVTYPGAVPLLVVTGMALQQLDDRAARKGKPLLEARQALQLATELDPRSVDALIELGFFFYSMHGNSRRALDLFVKTIRLGSENLLQAHIGRIKCLLDLGMRRATMDALREATRLFPKDDAIRELRTESKHWRFRRREPSTPRAR
jgi:tetratricopeptide (TPR) repeat protein